MSPRPLRLVVSLLCFPFLILISEASSSNIYHTCSNESTYPSHSDNLNLLLFYLSSNATSSNKGFYNATAGIAAPDVAYGLFLCRGDVPADVCRECLMNATNEIINLCSRRREAIIWYDDCMLRYANRSFFAAMDDAPRLSEMSTHNINIKEEGRFQQVLAETMKDLSHRVANDATNSQIVKRFATQEANFGGLQKLYGLAQCTQDLSEADCSRCLGVAVALLPRCCGAKRGGRVLLPSCNIRYDVDKFYRNVAIAPPPTTTSAVVPPLTPSSRGRERRNTKLIMISASVSAFLVVLLLGFCIAYGRRRTKRTEEEKKEYSQEDQLMDLAGNKLVDDYSSEKSPGENQVKSQDFPLIRLDVIRAATQQFSEENKLGEGGFGPVYKGTLVDGEEIAVKRLSRNSGQGLHEFKNEVTSISRLQHRNLVKLLGCCLEGNELLLVYDYMPNHSLDVFLFDSIRGSQLDWKRRLSIINGIARGLLYLHEDSRLRIIHRDLKASNILLDHEMNPKISDFGMARIFGGDQSEANTNRVVGTYGYMAPEYAMEGLFSVKSDVFSFGVLLLEIVSGKKNSRFYLYEGGESLLTFAWKLWCKGEGLELMHPLLTKSCVTSEVLKCIHIGLLCVQEDPADRPTMSSVVLMLGRDTVTLPRPAEPAFSVGRVVFALSQTQTSDRVSSVNVITLSNMSTTDSE